MCNNITTPMMKLEDNTATYCEAPMEFDYLCLSKKLQKFIEFTVNESFLHDSALNSKIAAMLIYKNRPISVGYNSTKTHPLQAKYGKNTAAICIHAEIDCIRKSCGILEVEDFKKSTLIVMRTKRDKTWGLARPCISINGQGCQMAIHAFGIKNVIYSTNKTGMVAYL